MKETIYTHIKENAKDYLVLASIFLIGILLGIFLLQTTSDTGKAEIGEYVNTFSDEMQTGKIEYFELFKASAKNNIKLLAAMFLISLTFFAKFGVYAITGYKGFEMGYTIASLTNTFGLDKGMMYAGCLILISKIIYIPTILFLANRSKKLYEELRGGEKKEKKVAIVKYLIILAIVFIFLLISSLIETFISSNLFVLILGH